MTLIGIVGIIGRIFGLSFGFVKYTFWLIGLIELGILFWMTPGIYLPRIRFNEFFHEIFENIPLLLALILAVSMTFNGYQFFIDDTSYGAYVANWLNSTHLGFINLVHHFDKLEEVRFWIAMYPMGQALLADLSGIPGILLLSNYLELYLIPLAIFASYGFARSLSLSRKEAGIAVLIQTFFYVLMIDDAWPVGFWFFQNMAEDKITAVFLLAPVFFTFVLICLQYPTRKSLLLVFLCSLGLTLTHPVILFLACAIAAGLIVSSWIMKKSSLRVSLELMIVIVLSILPYAVLRLYDDQYSQTIPYNAESVGLTYEAERYVNVVTDVFYGLNPDVLKLLDINSESGFYDAFQIVRLLPVIVVITAAILALVKFREGPLYWYILTCALLITFAAIPYTGWILGYFISARMLSRVSWFLPLGLSGVVLWMYFSPWLRSRHSSGIGIAAVNAQMRPPQQVIKVILTCFVFTTVMLVAVVTPNAREYFNVLDHNRQLAQIGVYIDRNTSASTTVIALDYMDIQKIPSVSAHASLISFREEKVYNPHNYFLSVEEIEKRMNVSNLIRSLNPYVPAEKKCQLLDEYKVSFVVADTKNAEQYSSLITTCKRQLVTVYRTDDLVLLEYR